MRIAVPVCKRETSGTIARSPEERCQNTATGPATAVMERENELDVTKNAKSSHLSSWAIATREAMLQAMKTVSYVYTKEF